MQVCSRIKFLHRLYEDINKFIIVLASSPRPLQAKVQLVVEKLLIVGPAIKYHRKCPRRVDTRAESSKNEFRYRNQNASYSLITYAEDFFAISDYDVVNILRVTPLSHIFLDPVFVEDVEEASFGFPEEAGEILNGITFCWRVDDAEYLFQMVLDQL